MMVPRQMGKSREKGQKICHPFCFSISSYFFVRYVNVGSQQIICSELGKESRAWNWSILRLKNYAPPFSDRVRSSERSLSCCNEKEKFG